MVASVIESVNGTERVLQQYSLTNGAPLEISFAPQASANNWILIGPNINLTPLPSYTYTIETICITDQVTTQQNVLVAVCDDKGDKYRYGFNGQMKDNDWAGIGNHNTAEFWEYDTRTGRRYNVDPLTDETPFESSYSTMGNNPTNNIDPNGNSWTPVDKNGKSVSVNDKEKINGYNWVDYDTDDKGNKVARPNTVETAYTFGENGMTTLSSEGYTKHETWQAYRDISTGNKSTDARLATLHSDVQDQMKSFILKAKYRFGIDLRVVQGFRTVTEQDRLYAQGRTAPGNKVTNARGGYSNHNFGLAIDVAPFENGKINWDSKNYPLIGRIGESRGLEWGGRWKTILDLPHFQNLFGKTLRQLRALPKDAKGLPIFNK